MENMKRKAFSGIVLMLFLTSTFSTTFNIHTVGASGTIYIRPDGSVDPPTAPIQHVGDATYIFTANISDTIVVERNSIVVDGAGYTLRGLWNGIGIDLSHRMNVTVKEIRITSFGTGILLSDSSGNTLSDSTVINNTEYGINLVGSSRNTLQRNNIIDNRLGINLDASGFNTLSGNAITNDYEGIHLYSSSTNTFSGNIVTNNQQNPILIERSSGNTFSGNTVTNNYYDGIWLWGSSDNELSNNTVTTNYGHGIVLQGSSRNTLHANNILDNHQYGIYLRRTIYSGSTDNTILRNTITNNGGGIQIYDDALLPPYSYGNLIYHNNFIDNTVQVHVEYENTWDDGYPSGGNYWSDYTGLDEFSGPYQNETENDGIGDTPYIINAKNRDRYPHMHILDFTPPITPVVADDGEYTSSTTWLHATWSSSDPESGIADYHYAIGTSREGTDIVGWTSVGTATEVTHIGLNLIIGSTYYFSVKAKNEQGLWSEVGTSDGITVTIITFDLSPGWGTKELFVPIYYPSREAPGTVVLGVHNRRDMWYLVEVYGRQPPQPWERMHPWDLPYLAPWGEKTFSYVPEAGDEIKLVVWNDLNDETLTALWTLDFATRALLGVSISSQVTNSEEFTVKLATFYNEVLTAVGYLRIGQWKKAALELGKVLATSTKAQGALVSLLELVGIKVTIGTIVSKALLMPFNYIVNVLSTGGWRLIVNANKEPFTEEVIFTAREKVPPAIPDVRVTKSLTIIQEEPYYVGETINAQFSITNRGTAPIVLNIVTVGGRGPKGDADVRDFSFKTDLTLTPGGSYHYEGELKLLDSGSYHFFIAYQTSDGKWETSVPTEAETVNTMDITVNPIPERWIVAELGSPGELRVYDSQNRITGLVSGEDVNEIPYSIYYENIVVILAPADSYLYQVAGTGEGSYNLTVTNATEQELATFNATDIPTSANAIHQYTIDWTAVSQGGGGVTVQIDSDGDGMSELTFTSDNELTRDEFMSHLPPEEVFPMWIVGVAVATIAIVTVAIGVFWRRRKQPPTKG